MDVVVKPYIYLREIMGNKQITLELNIDTTISLLLQILRQDYGLPNQFKAGNQVLRFFDGNEPVGLIILIDGRNIKQLQGTDTILHQNAVVSLFPPAAGG
ncbi:MAG: MoaD/ThiS family protein [Dethiobacteria bacterium]|nr:MoaD/ThiS family protein [Bacillota bacterium]MDW7730016.1 MoaD/ThiS family protein [Bacillota bacterium]